MNRRQQQRERNKLYKRKKREEKESALRTEAFLADRAAWPVHEERTRAITVDTFEEEIIALEQAICGADQESGFGCLEDLVLDERLTTPYVDESESDESTRD